MLLGNHLEKIAKSESYKIIKFIRRKNYEEKF